jgi:cytochrome c oxidase assembly protein subunit 15
VTTTRTADDGGARRAYRWLATAAIALTFAVIAASAYLRHWQAGLSCEPWPACYARIDSAAAEPTAAVRVARTIHRLSATAVAALIVALLLVAWTQRPVWLREALVASAALSVAAALAVLGIVAPASKSPGVVLGNLVGGHVLLTLVAAGLSLSIASPTSSKRAGMVAAAALVCALGVTMLGGLIGAQYASGACRSLWDCTGAHGRAIALPALFSAPATADGRFVAPDGAASLHGLHRLAGAASAVLAGAVIYRMRRDRQQLAVALSAALAVTLLAGAAGASTQPALAYVVLHNAAAAGVCAALAMAAATPRRASEPFDHHAGTTIA